MTKTIKLGKIDGYNIGRKSCDADVEFGFREFEGQEPYFTAVATVWNCRHTDCIMAGQCLDELNKYKSICNNLLFNKIYGYWKMYHLKPKSNIPTDVIMDINELLNEEV